MPPISSAVRVGQGLSVLLDCRQQRVKAAMRPAHSTSHREHSRSAVSVRATATTDATGSSASEPAHAQNAWTQLEAPLLWSGPETDAICGDATADLTPGFKIMLLSDGSVTRHLQLLTGHQIKADCLEMGVLPREQDGLPSGVERLRGPLVQRQVLLKEQRPAAVSNGSGGEPSSLGPALVYAASWWNAAAAAFHLGDQKSRPIGVSLKGLELRREIGGVFHGHSAVLERAFGAEGPFWGREYTLWKGREPLTVIYEVFSPRLQRYFGTCQL